MERFFLKGLFLTSCVVFFTSILLGSMSFLANSFLSSGEEKDTARVYEYRYYERDYETKRSSTGFVTQADPLDGDYETFEEEKRSVLISSFESTEYECYGSCYCDDVKRRGYGGSNTLVKGASYILAATSSVLAYQISKDYFSNECEKKFVSVCESGSIRSEIDICQPFVQNLYREPNEDEEIKKTEEEIKKEEVVEEKNEGPDPSILKPGDEESPHYNPEDIFTYYCYGHCLNRILYSLDTPFLSEKQIKEIEEYPDCHKLKQEGEVHFKDADVPPALRKVVATTTRRDFRHTSARISFVLKYMQQFCIENGPSVKWQAAKQETMFPEPEEPEFSICVGENGRSGPISVGGYVTGNQVKCILTDSPRFEKFEFEEKRWWNEKRLWDEGKIEFSED